jgi:hypothetical protein
LLLLSKKKEQPKATKKKKKLWGQINKKTLKCSLWSHLLSQKKFSIRKFKPQQLTRNETKKKKRKKEARYLIQDVSHTYRLIEL